MAHSPLSRIVLAAGLVLLSSCAARTASQANDILEEWPLAAGWSPCHGAPGSCTATLTLGTDQQSSSGFCYEVVVKSPEETGPLSFEVYTADDIVPITAAELPANPNSAGFCLSAPSDPEPLVLKVFSLERARAGASVAIFREP